MQINNVLVRPIITEKATTLAKSNVFAFEVHVKANKDQIAEVLKTLYNVTVDSVRVATRKGKVKRVGRTGKTKQLSDIKIAYVTIKNGSFDLFPKA